MLKFNNLSTIQSQYSASPTINALTQGFADLINPINDISSLFNAYINLDTAFGTGLGNWGEIVGFTRVQNNITLEDSEYRRFLKIKMAANISGVTLKNLNDILSKIFQDRGTVYVLDVGIMRIRYLFNFELTPIEETLLLNESLLPRPGCVGFEIGYIKEGDIFGYNGQELANFNNGYFETPPIFANKLLIEFEQFIGQEQSATFFVFNQTDKLLNLTITSSSTQFICEPIELSIGGKMGLPITVQSLGINLGVQKGSITITPTIGEKLILPVTANVIVPPQEPNIWLFGKNGWAYRSTDGHMFEPVTDKFGVVTAAGWKKIYTLEGHAYLFPNDCFIAGDATPLPVGDISSIGKYITSSSVWSCIDNYNLLYPMPFSSEPTTPDKVLNVINIEYMTAADAFFVTIDGGLYAQPFGGSPQPVGLIKGTMIAASTPKMTVIIGNNVEFEGISPNANVFIGYDSGTFKEVVTGLNIKEVLTVWYPVTSDGIGKTIVIYSQDTIVITHDFFETHFTFPSEITIDRLYLGRFEDSPTLKVATLIATSNGYFYTAKITATANIEEVFSATLSPWVKVDINISADVLSYITANNGTTYSTEKYK